MWRYRLLLSLVVGLALLPPAGRPAAAQPDARCFPETGLCIAGPIRAYWERNGGLPVFGYPTTEQRFETVEGRGLYLQWFERDRLEIQQEGYVTAGRLGARLLELRGTPWESFPITNDRPPECDWFALTGHITTDSFPAWSPDGSQIAFWSFRVGAHDDQRDGRRLA